MKIKYLGTGAAEGIPGMFCNCETCRKSLELGGKNIRTRSQAMIDDFLLMDFGPDTYHHLLMENKMLYDLKHLIITHEHTDHLCSAEFEWRIPGYCYGMKYPTLEVYCSALCKERMDKVSSARNNVNMSYLGTNVHFNIVDKFTPFFIEDYKITPFPATHMHPSDTPFVYLIEKNNKTLLYYNDSGLMKSEVYQYLVDNKIYIDYLSLDCTKGNTDAKYESHCSIEECNEICARLLANKNIDNNTIKVLTHFSHNCGMTHDELKEVANKYGYIVAYDGMEVQF